MLTATIYLRAAFASPLPAWTRSACLAVSSLCKPPQVAFVILEALASSPRRYGRAVLVVLPAMCLPLAWIWFAGSDVAIWRIADPSQYPPGHLSPLWRLRHMLEQPSHFPRLLLHSLAFSADYARQLIGVLGWLDVPLRPFAYPLLSALLILAVFAPIELEAPARRRLAIWNGLAAVGYCLAVFLVFYLAWSLPDADRIEGVQGRYFLAALPLTAVAVSAAIRGGFKAPTRATAALLGAVLAGCATIEAVLRVEWKLAL
jgi:hypothetical protein